MCLRNRSLVSWWLINLGSVNLALVEIVPSVLIVIVSPIEIALIISLMVLNGRKTGRSNLICNPLRSYMVLPWLNLPQALVTYTIGYCHDKCFLSVVGTICSATWMKSAGLKSSYHFGNIGLAS
ncbi:hypothetical protein Tco_0170142 [Tanacetum coccineum]